MIATGPGGAWRTTDYGATWTEVIDTTPHGMGGICAGPSGWVAVSNSGDIYVSYDDGVTWTINGSRADSDYNNRGAGVTASVNYENSDDQMMAVFGGSVMISMDAGRDLDGWGRWRGLAYQRRGVSARAAGSALRGAGQRAVGGHGSLKKHSF